jgi:uncharacterized protein YbbC (DUF1343 family)
MQIHITDIDKFKPVEAALEIFDAIIETSAPDSLKFKLPPYEYENTLMPFDILSGDSGMRSTLISRNNLQLEKERWADEIEEFRKEFLPLSLYKE